MKLLFQKLKLLIHCATNRVFYGIFHALHPYCCFGIHPFHLLETTCSKRFEGEGGVSLKCTPEMGLKNHPWDVGQLPLGNRATSQGQLRNYPCLNSKLRTVVFKQQVVYKKRQDVCKQTSSCFSQTT